MTVGAMLGFVAVLSGALLVYLARTVVPRADDPIPPDVPPANCVLALGLLWLPWIALVAAKVGGGGVAARYTIGAALGLALSASYVAYWLGRRASALILMCLLLAFASKEVVFWGAEYYGRNLRRVDIEGFERLLSHGDPALPVVVANGREFVRSPTTRRGRSRAGWSPSSTLSRARAHGHRFDRARHRRCSSVPPHRRAELRGLRGRRTPGSCCTRRPATANGGRRACSGTVLRCERSPPTGAGCCMRSTQGVDTSAFVGPLEPGLLEWLAVRRTADHRYPMSSRRSSVGRAADS